MRYWVTLLLIIGNLMSFCMAQRDPTRPEIGTFTGREGGPLRLDAVIVSSDHRVAIINDRIVKIGDEIDGNRILSIESNKVKTERGNTITVLYLLNQTVKRQVTD